MLAEALVLDLAVVDYFPISQHAMSCFIPKLLNEISSDCALTSSFRLSLLTVCVLAALFPAVLAGFTE